MYNLVWQSVICRPGKLLIPFSEEKNQMLQLAAPTARRRRSTWGKRARRGQADYGQATPSLRQPAPGAILILIVAGEVPQRPEMAHRLRGAHQRRQAAAWSQPLPISRRCRP